MIDARDFARLQSCHNHNERHIGLKMASNPSDVPYGQTPRLFDTTLNGSRLSYYHFLLGTFHMQIMFASSLQRTCNTNHWRAPSPVSRIWEVVSVRYWLGINRRFCWTMPVPSLDRTRTSVGISRWVTQQKPRTLRTSFRHLVVLLLLNQSLLPLYLMGHGQSSLLEKWLHILISSCIVQSNYKDLGMQPVRRKAS